MGEKKQQRGSVSFRAYLQTRSHSRDWIGKLAAQLLTESPFPSIRSGRALQRFFESKRIAPNEPIYEVARDLWTEYAGWYEMNRARIDRNARPTPP